MKLKHGYLFSFWSRTDWAYWRSTEPRCHTDQQGHWWMQWLLTPKLLAVTAAVIPVQPKDNASPMMHSSTEPNPWPPFNRTEHSTVHLLKTDTSIRCCNIWAQDSTKTTPCLKTYPTFLSVISYNSVLPASICTKFHKLKLSAINHRQSTNSLISVCTAGEHYYEHSEWILCPVREWVPIWQFDTQLVLSGVSLMFQQQIPIITTTDSSACFNKEEFPEHWNWKQRIVFSTTS